MEMEISWSLGYSPYRPGAPARFGLDLRDGRHQRIGGLRRHRHRGHDRADAQPILPDFTAIARLDDIVAKAYPPPANPRGQPARPPDRARHPIQRSSSTAHQLGGHA